MTIDLTNGQHYCVRDIVTIIIDMYGIRDTVTSLIKLMLTFILSKSGSSAEKLMYSTNSGQQIVNSSNVNRNKSAGGSHRIL